MRKLLSIVIFGLSTSSVLALASCGKNPEVDACVMRGVEYFKAIDSFPKLSDGRDAIDVAIERCNRTATAF
jgi:hypothetical protein